MLGLLAVAAIPAALVVAELSERFELLHAAVAIPLAIVLGAAALVLGARARRAAQFTLGRMGGERLGSLGRALGALGVYLGATAALALGFYGLLTVFD